MVFNTNFNDISVIS